MQRGQRGELGGLEHDGVAGGDGGQDLPGRHLQRVVPRGDRPDDADRLAADRSRCARRSTRRWPCPRGCAPHRRRRRRCRWCRARRTRGRAGSACPPARLSRGPAPRPGRRARAASCAATSERSAGRRARPCREARPARRRPRRRRRRPSERAVATTSPVDGVDDRQRVRRPALTAPSVDELLARVVDRWGHGCSLAVRWRR